MAQIIPFPNSDAERLWIRAGMHRALPLTAADWAGDRIEAIIDLAAYRLLCDAATGEADLLVRQG